MGDAFGKVAIVGMSVRTAGANDLESFWEVVRSGREAVHFFPDDERPAVPNYVRPSRIWTTSNRSIPTSSASRAARRA